jgi:DNA polymerase-3 subunit epsilon
MRRSRTKVEQAGDARSASAKPIDGEPLARALAQVPGYRVLRALDLDQGVDKLGTRRKGERIAIVADTETTGLDPADDRLVEIAVQRFFFNQQGVLRQIERTRSWLEDPGRSMPERLVKLTGLTDAQLAGQVFPEGEITRLLCEADLIIAHNAAFDRAFLDRRFPAIHKSAWACSLHQLDWLALGFDGHALGHLLFQSGKFFTGHRAGNDVAALTSLLGEVAPDGRTVFAHLLARSETDSVRIDAVGAPFEAKDDLRRRGYRWNADQRVWWLECDSSDVSGECAWLNAQVYRGRGRPNLAPITARERFAERRGPRSFPTRHSAATEGKTGE